MSSIARRNIYELERMGYEVEQVPELNEVRIILRSKQKFGFALYVEYYDLQGDDIVRYIVGRFNSMITNKLELIE